MNPVRLYASNAILRRDFHGEVLNQMIIYPLKLHDREIQPLYSIQNVADLKFRLINLMHYD